LPSGNVPLWGATPKKKVGQQFPERTLQAQSRGSNSNKACMPVDTLKPLGNAHSKVDDEGTFTLQEVAAAAEHQRIGAYFAIQSLYGCPRHKVRYIAGDSSQKNRFE
jgi:hypothetical protein